tara:strand:- start:2250 stop:3167 length:918 start_codon:yes stop_codon:yes gene_type:complete
MERLRLIQIIYAPGTFGNTLRWLLDRFTEGSKFQDLDSPWDKHDRSHGFEKVNFNPTYTRGHQALGRDDSPDPLANKVVISFAKTELIFAERCGFYRNPGWENDHARYKNIIAEADQSFISKEFGTVESNKSIAKELYKIQFHDMENNTWWNAMNNMIADDRHFRMDVNTLWSKEQLIYQLEQISKKYKLNLQIDQKVISNVVEKIKNSFPVQTKDRVYTVLDAIQSKQNTSCESLDIIEQAFVETELEKKHDCVIFGYGTNWFSDTKQINEFIDTYPQYLKHMNPRLPWYKNRKNPFYLKRQID